MESKAGGIIFGYTTAIEESKKGKDVWTLACFCLFL
jgi:hypothetical protein